jgi:hypothetical protein
MHWSLPFWLLAAAGFLLSAITHIGTFVGINVEAMMPVPFGLHFALFIVFVPAVIVSILDSKKEGPELEHLKQSTRFAPSWMKALLIFLMPYALFNFFFTLFILKEGGGPAIINGQKVLSSHGEIIRSLSNEEFIAQTLYEIRLFSGHWMALYGVAWVTLYSHFACNMGWPQSGRPSDDVVPPVPELTLLESNTALAWLSIRNTYSCERCGYEGRGPWTVGDITGLIAKICVGVVIVSMVTGFESAVIPAIIIAIVARWTESYLPGKRPCPRCSNT